MDQSAICRPEKRARMKETVAEVLGSHLLDQAATVQEGDSDMDEAV